MKKALLLAAASLGLGMSAFLAPGISQAIPITRRVAGPTRNARLNLFSAPRLVGTRSAHGSVARDKRAAVKTKNRKANRRNHV